MRRGWGRPAAGPPGCWAAWLLGRLAAGPPGCGAALPWAAITLACATLRAPPCAALCGTCLGRQAWRVCGTGGRLSSHLLLCQGFRRNGTPDQQSSTPCATPPAPRACAPHGRRRADRLCARRGQRAEAGGAGGGGRGAFPGAAGAGRAGVGRHASARQRCGKPRLQGRPGALAKQHLHVRGSTHLPRPLYLRSMRARGSTSTPAVSAHQSGTWLQAGVRRIVSCMAQAGCACALQGRPSLHPRGAFRPTRRRRPATAPPLRAAYDAYGMTLVEAAAQVREPLA